jgi:hypothetical protein
MAKSPKRSSKSNAGAKIDRSAKSLVLRGGRRIPLATYHLPLSRRFSLGLSEKAYRALRRLSAETSLGNNYALTVLLENAENTIDRRAFRRAAERLKAAFAKPAA